MPGGVGPLTIAVLLRNTVKAAAARDRRRVTMRRAALTGGIATRKSYCLERFASLGARVVDADRLAREAVAPGTAGLARVIERFGPSSSSLTAASIARTGPARVRRPHGASRSRGDHSSRGLPPD